MIRNIFRSLSRGRRQAQDSHGRDRSGEAWSGPTGSSGNRRDDSHRREPPYRYRDDPEDEDEDDEEELDLEGGGNEQYQDEDEDEEDHRQGQSRQYGEPSYFDHDPSGPRSRDDGNGYSREDRDGDRSDEDGDEDAPLLPIFSSAHLDALPLYNTTHAIRLLVIQRCETTLSWDQLRSPQISQFLVKPIQSDIRSNHFNRATLCALIANCLQFHKEAQLHPGNIGVLRTRALACELLAMRLLREFSTWELIDALSYDFNPLQGISAPDGTREGREENTIQGQAGSSSRPMIRRPPSARTARVSTIEVAIRAEAKRFLAHPLVVQHLEAIWAGHIVFHSEQDDLHRRTPRPQPSPQFRNVDYGTTGTSKQREGPGTLPQIAVSAPAGQTQNERLPARRSVTLYDPRDASLFKLSRLRVPRYRQVFTTLSFAAMLGLFVAVLVERSVAITPMEVLFWIWSAGYMLDEVVGFTEQGFGLYILSFWNAFDLGILALFAVYYCLRLYGVLLAETGRHRIASVAYDVLASTAILLFPRLFGVLDHYRYFSQLLIAFRLMAQDLLAILVLILIFCSGFFVAFTLSFSDDSIDANGVAYIIFQIVMGFTPAAWDHWASYNILGKAIMAIFLIICHFLIVTILITVLTNSFMAIVKNAEEEHQFLFAINTISMVKSDALFSYVAPANVIGWVLSPLRYVMPMRRYVKFNRTIIKVTHFPILFVIFLHERLFMARSSYVAIDLVQRQQGRLHQRGPVAFGLSKVPELFSPAGPRMREASVIGYRKDQALDEVFRRPFQGDTLRTSVAAPREVSRQRRNSTTVDHWMQLAENEGGASPPLEQPRSVLERLELRRPFPSTRLRHRPKPKRLTTSERLRINAWENRNFSSGTHSPGGRGDEADRLSVQSDIERRRPSKISEEFPRRESSNSPHPQETDLDGDVDESQDIDQDDDRDTGTLALGESALSVHDPDVLSRARAVADADDSDSEYFHTPVARPGKSPMTRLSHAGRARLLASGDIDSRDSSANDPMAMREERRREQLMRKQQQHDRTTSSGTILFMPDAVAPRDSESERKSQPSRPPLVKTPTAINTKSGIPVALTDAPSQAEDVRSGLPSEADVPVGKGNRDDSRLPPSDSSMMSGRKDDQSGSSRPSRPALPPKTKTTPAGLGGLFQIGGLTFLPTARGSGQDTSSEQPNTSVSKTPARTKQKTPQPPRPKALLSRPTLPALTRDPRAGPSAGRGGGYNQNTLARPRFASFTTRALDLASEIGDNKFYDPASAMLLSGSFEEELDLLRRGSDREARDRHRRPRGEQGRRDGPSSHDDDYDDGDIKEKGMVNRIMLARMNTLEEGFKEVLREIRGIGGSLNASFVAASATPSQTQLSQQLQGGTAMSLGSRSGWESSEGLMMRQGSAARLAVGSGSSPPKRTQGSPPQAAAAMRPSLPPPAGSGFIIGSSSSSTPRKAGMARKESRRQRLSADERDTSSASASLLRSGDEVDDARDRPTAGLSSQRPATAIRSREFLANEEDDKSDQ